MALNTEPGAALADSLCTVAQADAFHAARGNTLWAPLTTPEKEQALRRATDYMAVYSSRWKGARQTLKFQAVDNMLAPYLAGSAWQVRVVRA